jgi:hypothetical protein
LRSAATKVGPRHPATGRLLPTALHSVLFRLLFTESDVALSRGLAELAPAELALDAVVCLLLHLPELCLLLMAEASSAHATVALLGSPGAGANCLSELQGLQFPLGDLACRQLLLLFFFSLLSFLVCLRPLSL